MEWNSMRKFIDSLRAGVQPQAEATMMTDTGEVVHNCAKHVEHAEWGKGTTVAEEHAAPDDAGNIAWYDVMFEHGLEREVPTDTLNILVSESHGHAVKKKAVKEEEDLTTKVKGKAVTDAEETDDEEDDDDEKSGKMCAKESVEELDELSKKTLGSYVKGAADRATHNRRMAVSSWERADRETDDKEKEKFNDFGQSQFKKYKNRIAGVGRAVDRLTKEDLQFTEEVDETIEYKTIDIAVNEADKNYDGYFKAAMKAHGVKHPGELKSAEDKKKFFNKVDAGFNAKNEDVFVEAWMRSDIEERMAAHKKAGNKISDATHTTKNGEAYHAYVVTEPSGKRTRHIFHGNSRKLETMSAAPKSNLAKETGEDDDK